MPLEGVVIATLAGLLAGGRPATACPRLAQNSSTAAVTAFPTNRRRSRVARSSSSCRFTIDPASSGQNLTFESQGGFLSSLIGQGQQASRDVLHQNSSGLQESDKCAA